ncbi:MAG: beta-galactosidase [Armatimonadetes bacterium]|nr:beta-galactosidase [Armatimonadota bacterium]
MPAHDIPRPEYPRPQFARDDWLNLNGEWEFARDPGLSGEARGWRSGQSLPERILVPFPPESALSGIGDRDFMPCVWYRRAFSLPDNWQGKRVLLHFGAVDYETTVWVNGKEAGGHRGGYSSFHFDITPFLGSGENEIVVRAVDDTRSPLQPTGKQSTEFGSFGCVYTRTTGIWQTVWLEAVPEVYLRSTRLIPDLDGGQIIIQARIEGKVRRHRLSARASAEGALCGEVAGSISGSNALLILPLKGGRLWSPEDPFLYDLDFTLESDRGPGDRVQSYFGMRKIHLEGLAVCLNGQPLFQRLVLDQGFYPDGIYTASSDDALRRDIEISQGLGFNGARLHEKVFEPRFLYWADKLGYLVWGEYPNWGLDHSHPEALERMIPEWLEVLERDYNHPSIVGWCPFNETLRSQNPWLLRTIYRATKVADPTRPVIDTSGYRHVETDIYDCHNYEQDPERFAAAYRPFAEGGPIWQNDPDHEAPYADQPYFVSEYGGTWWNPDAREADAWGYGNRPATSEEFLARYRALTESLLFHPKMCAFCYTQLYDVEQEVNGLYTYDRRPKFDPALFHAINTQKAAIEEEG